MNPKIKWLAPYPGAYWLDQREDRAVLDVLHKRALFRYYGVKKPNHVATLEATARGFYGVKYALGVNSGTGAVGSVQLTKLPRIIQHMRASKRRIKALLKSTPGIAFRRLNDEAGDSGPFMIFTLGSSEQAQRVVKQMQTAGLASAVRLADYGMHIYFDIPQLTNKVALSPAGNPRSLPQNQNLVRDYGKGACPRSDDLFARSILLPIPSRLNPAQEKAAAHIIQAALV